MSLLNNPKYNSPEIDAALLAHGLSTDKHNQLSDAFRLGWAAAQPGWKPERCAECDCEFGGMQCSWIKGEPHVSHTPKSS